MYTFDGSKYTGTAMFAANSHDVEFCNWLETAQIGDSFCGCKKVD